MTEIVNPETIYNETPLHNVSEEYVAQKPQGLSFTRKATGSVMLAASLSALTYQQLPTNEAVRTAITLEAYENTDDKLIAGLAAGGATMLTEGGTSTLIALGLASEKSAASKLIERYRRRKAGKKLLDETEDDQIHTGSSEISLQRKVGRSIGNASIALTLGPRIVVLKKHLTGENSSLRAAVKTGIGYSVFGSVVSAGVFGYGVTEGKSGLEGVAEDTPFEVPVDVITDPKSWAAGVAVAGIALGISKIRNRNRVDTSLEGVEF